jgi:phage protein U
MVVRITASTSWQRIAADGPPALNGGVNEPTTNTGLGALMSWGPIIFQVWPLNYDSMDHETATDWAHKEIAGAAVYREWVGEEDETRLLRGSIFPYRIGGMSQIEKFDQYRRGGIANLLVGGDGRNLGWFVCEKLSRQHTFISAEGIGQQIQFEASMARVPVPEPADFFAMIWGQAIPVIP